MMRKAKAVFFVARSENVQGVGIVQDVQLSRWFSSRFQARKAQRRIERLWPDAYCVRSRIRVAHQ